MMSYWTFSDVFEEQGVVKEPFYGGFGVIAAGGIPKPSYYAFQVLHRLGDQRIENTNQDVLVTKTSGGTLVIALWNIVNPGSTGGPRTVKLDFKGVKPGASVRTTRVDAEHGNTLALVREDGQDPLSHGGTDQGIARAVGIARAGIQRAKKWKLDRRIAGQWVGGLAGEMSGAANEKGN